MNEILQLILIEVQPVAVAAIAAAVAVAIGPVVERKNVTFDPSSSVKHPAILLRHTAFLNTPY